VSAVVAFVFKAPDAEEPVVVGGRLVVVPWQHAVWDAVCPMSACRVFEGDHGEAGAQPLQERPMPVHDITFVDDVDNVQAFSVGGDPAGLVAVEPWVERRVALGVGEDDDGEVRCPRGRHLKGAWCCPCGED